MKPAHAVAVLLAGFVDLALIVTFTLIGRASHGEGLLGLLTTLWPFFVGLCVGWAVSRAWLSPFRVRFTGLIVWVSTVAVGLLLRAAVGQGVQLSFVIVTTVVLGIFLLGWRLIRVLVLRQTQRRRERSRVD